MDKYYKSKSELSKKRSRSRSPHRNNDGRDDRHYDREIERYRHRHHKKDERGRRSRSRSSSSSSSSSSTDERSDNKRPASASQPPKMSFNKSTSSSNKSGIQIKLGAPSQVKPTLVQKTPKISNIFNDDDSEPEEMPAEAKMRMRNIGKETPTSSGPNSFGKTKQGFIDSKKIFERKLKQMAEKLSDD